MNLFLTLSLILLGGVLLHYLCKLIHCPPLIGYLFFGIFLSFLNEKITIGSVFVIAPEMDEISSVIRKIALIIILCKAGLTLNLSDLKKVGRPAILMSFVPAVVEMCAVGVFAPLLLPLTYTESFLFGSVLGAVSPAVVIPMMSKMMDQSRGTAEGIPQLIIAASSIDDIVMIVFYQAFLQMEKGESISAMTFLNIPISILLGVAVGILLGFLLSLLFHKVTIRDSMKLILIFGVAFLLTFLEDALSSYFGFSSLLAIISFCIVLRRKNKEQSERLALRCNKMWVVAEMFLFILVGASIQISYALNYFFTALLLILISLSFRSLAVSGCLIKTRFCLKERAFCVLSFLPKATVQAAIGSGLLDYAMLSNNAALIQSGNIVLSISVVYILITAPLGALLMNLTYRKLLKEEVNITK